MIKRVYVSNFRSFDKLSLDLAPFNVLIGANGVGKSNLVDVFRFLRECVESSLAIALSRRQGWQAVRCRKRYRKEVRFVIEGDLQEKVVRFGKVGKRQPQEVQGPFPYKYEFAFQHMQSGEDQVIGEEGLLNTSEQGMKFEQESALSSFRRDKEKASIAGTGEEALKGRDSMPIHESAKSRLFVGSFLSVASVLISEEIERWKIYNPDPNEARKPHLAEDVNELSETGDNLALVLHEMDQKTSARQPQEEAQTREKLRSIMGSLVPGFDRWLTKHLADGRISFEVKETPIRGTFSPFVVSDGTIRLLTLLAALLFPIRKASTIFIEEPERTLHPLVMEQLVELMREASRDSQIIVTTHSPDFVRYCEPSEVFLLDKVDGITQIEQARNRPNIEQFLESFSLDQLWTMGYLQKGLPW